MNEMVTDKINLFTETLGNVIKKLMDTHSINMHQLYKQTGVPITTINRMVNEKNVNPTISSLIPIADFFGVTLNQLMGLDPLGTDRLVGRYSKKNHLWTDVPIITWEQAIEWPNKDANSQDGVISTDIKVSKDCFALTIHEINLEGFFPKSIIIIDPYVKAEHGDHAAVVKVNQPRASLKQILIDDDLIYLRPLNKEYQTQVMDKNFRIIGVVLQVRMDRK